MGRDRTNRISGRARRHQAAWNGGLYWLVDFKDRKAAVAEHIQTGEVDRDRQRRWRRTFRSSTRQARPDTGHEHLRTAAGPRHEQIYVVYLPYEFEAATKCLIRWRPKGDSGRCHRNSSAATARRSLFDIRAHIRRLVPRRRRATGRRPFRRNLVLGRHVGQRHSRKTPVPVWIFSVPNVQITCSRPSCPHRIGHDGWETSIPPDQAATQQSAGQTAAHCGASNLPSHSVQRTGSMT